MKFPATWIREYVSTRLSDPELAELITSIGFPVDSIEQIEGENVFEIDITTNRPDCMNIIGLAREIAAATQGKQKDVKNKYKEEKTPSAQLGRVQILDPEHCPRYSGKVIRGVQIAPSPPWLAKRIIQVGLRPVNNVVDASNYVLFELGHPIHIFDFSKVKGNTIIVRRAKRGEKIIMIDGAGRVLGDDMLIIADETDPIAVAGVMGGHLSEVSDTTTDIFIESAYFNPRSVRITSKKLGLSTDASFRFERGADFEATKKAIDRVSSIIAECAGGNIASGFIDVIKKKPKPKEITVRLSRIDLLLGMKVTLKSAMEILRSLGMKVLPKGKGVFKVSVPSFRVDISREIDIIEEVARFIKYDALPCTIPFSTDQKVKNKPDRREETARTILSSSGYSEAINYSMISDEEDRCFSFYKDSQPLRIENPLSENVIMLRRSLIPGLFRNIAGNFSRGSKDLKLFEVGKAYKVLAGQPSDERKHVALLATGIAGEEHWSKMRRNMDLWDIKGAVEALLRDFDCAHTLTGSPDERFFVKDSSFEFSSMDGKRIAIGGRVNRSLESEHKIPQPVWAAEISLDEMPHSARTARFKPTSPLPIIKRDISIIIGEKVKYADIKSLLEEKWKDTSVEIELGNRYSGTPIPVGKVSLMLSVTINQEEKTLTNEEINDIMNTIFGILSDGTGAELRKE